MIRLSLKLVSDINETFPNDRELLWALSQQD